MKILLTYGTRPEWIKVSPLIKEFKKNDIDYMVLFTGQQKHIGEFEYDFKFEIENGDNRLDSIVKSLLDKLPNIIKEHKITHILVQGDTTSVLGLALSGFHNGIKVIHLEAGLRTYDKDNPFPEEINRRVVTQIADIHFCPTTDNLKTIVSEVNPSKSVYVVGNTVIDNLVEWKDKVDTDSNNILITLHRRENLHWIGEWFKEINKIANNYPHLNFIFPAHPNPIIQNQLHILDSKNINVIKPVSHHELLDLLVKSRMVITDSGGLQEECSFFNIKCLVCRKVTERPEVVGKSSELIYEPQDLEPIFDKFVDNYQIDYECPYGDGYAASKITKILKKYKLDYYD